MPNQRFPPYFAEVRPFFIENSSYFATPISLYYTDNIEKPQYGARLTGKLGSWAMGILGVDDRSPRRESCSSDDPEYNTRADFYVGRLNRDTGSLSNVGFIYADREYLDSFNRAGGGGLPPAAQKSLDHHRSGRDFGDEECQRRHARANRSARRWR